jgi:hypothetical protein
MFGICLGQYPMAIFAIISKHDLRFALYHQEGRLASQDNTHHWICLVPHYYLQTPTFFIIDKL